jgi:hypothetical protein
MHATDSSGGRNANLRIGQTFPHLTSDTERDAVADDDTGRAPWYHSQCYSKPKHSGHGHREMLYGFTA